MSESPLASIIIDSYNYGRFLAEAIDSALCQNYPHTEVIVVDDGSTDNSREVIASYGNRIIPVLQKNRGQAAAFNEGFRHCKGSVILFWIQMTLCFRPQSNAQWKHSAIRKSSRHIGRCM